MNLYEGFGRDNKARSHKSLTQQQWFNVIAQFKLQRPSELVLPILPFQKSALQKNKHLMGKFIAFERTHFARKAQTAMTPIGNVWWRLAMISPYWYHRVLTNMFKDLVEILQDFMFFSSFGQNLDKILFEPLS